MKTTRKIMALVMVMAIVFAMAVAASAETPTGTITIQNQQSGNTYDVYRMFDWVETANGSWYKINADWVAFNGEEVYFDLDEDGFLIKLNKTESEIATAAKTYVEPLTATYANVGSSIADAPYGYYLLVSNLGNNVAMGTLNSDAGLILREKNTEDNLPTIKKTIEDTVQEFKVGDTINFKIEIACNEGERTYTVHDRMKGASFDDKVVVGIEGLETSDYNVTLEMADLSDGCTFHVTIALKDGVASFKAYQKITITYSATVTEAAATEGLSNTASFNSTGGSTVEDKKETYTVKKVIAGTNTVLQGAEFELYEVVGGEYKPVKVFGVDNDGVTGVDYYRPAAEGETGVAIVAGEATIKMLEADKTYALEEIKAPAGYKVREGYIGANSENAFIVENEALGALPNTGGVGTTMFYIVGTMLVLGAATLLATKKRMAAN